MTVQKIFWSLRVLNNVKKYLKLFGIKGRDKILLAKLLSQYHVPALSDNTCDDPCWHVRFGGHWECQGAWHCSTWEISSKQSNKYSYEKKFYKFLLTNALENTEEAKPGDPSYARYFIQFSANYRPINKVTRNIPFQKSTHLPNCCTILAFTFSLFLL